MIICEITNISTFSGLSYWCRLSKEEGVWPIKFTGSAVKRCGTSGHLLTQVIVNTGCVGGWHTSVCAAQSKHIPCTCLPTQPGDHTSVGCVHAADTHPQCSGTPGYCASQLPPTFPRWFSVLVLRIWSVCTSRADLYTALGSISIPIMWAMSAYSNGEWAVIGEVHFSLYELHIG